MSERQLELLEERITDLEGFAVEVDDVFPYEYRRAAPGKLTVAQWKRQRIPQDVSVCVFGPDGDEVCGRKTLGVLRREWEEASE